MVEVDPSPKLSSPEGQFVTNLTLTFVSVVLLILFPFVVIALLVCLVLQLIAKTLAILLRPDLLDMLVDRGTMYACEDVYTKPQMNMVIHFVIAGDMSLEKLRQLFHQHILSARDGNGNLLYCRLTLIWTQFAGFLFWKHEENFELDKHVRAYDYTEPSLALPAVRTEEDLQRIIAPLIEKPHQDGRSPWEVLLISNYKMKDADGPHCVLTFRIHHGLEDGMSLLKMILRLFKSKQAQYALPKFPKLSLSEKFIRLLSMPFILPFIAAKMLINFNDKPHAWHPEEKLSRRYLTFCSDRIPTAKIQTIKNKLKTSYNAALHSIAVGAVSRFMREAGQEVPDSMSVLVSFPRPNHPDGMSNHSTGNYFKVNPTPRSAITRLFDVSSTFQTAAAMPLGPVVFDWGYYYVSWLPVPIAKLTHPHMTKCSLTLTSVPAPLDGLGLDGLRGVDCMAAVGHLAGSSGALGVLLSFAGYQRIIMTVDRVIFSNCKVPSNFPQLVDAEVAELLSCNLQNHTG